MKRVIKSSAYPENLSKVSAASEDGDKLEELISSIDSDVEYIMSGLNKISTLGASGYQAATDIATEFSSVIQSVISKIAGEIGGE